MYKKHQRNFITNCIFGFIFSIVGLFLFLFDISSNGGKDELYIWGSVAIVIFNIGLFLLGNAFVHKVKADFIRKQKQKNHQKEFSEEAATEYLK